MKTIKLLIEIADPDSAINTVDVDRIRASVMSHLKELLPCNTAVDVTEQPVTIEQHPGYADPPWSDPNYGPWVQTEKVPLELNKIMCATGADNEH